MCACATHAPRDLEAANGPRPAMQALASGSHTKTLRPRNSARLEALHTARRAPAHSQAPAPSSQLPAGLKCDGGRPAAPIAKAPPPPSASAAEESDEAALRLRSSSSFAL